MHNIDVEIIAMAREIIYWRKQYNKLQNQIGDTYRVEEGTVENIIRKYTIQPNIPNAVKFSDNEIPIEDVTPVKCNFDDIVLADEIIDLSKE